MESRLNGKRRHGKNEMEEDEMGSRQNGNKSYRHRIDDKQNCAEQSTHADQFDIQNNVFD